MEWTPVKSSNIAAVAYVDGTFYVRFTDGREYTHEGVPAGTYQALLTAGSVGSFYHHNIKLIYPGKKLEKTP